MIEEKVFEQLCINKFHDNMQSYLQDPDKKKTVGLSCKKSLQKPALHK